MQCCAAFVVYYPAIAITKHPLYVESVPLPSMTQVRWIYPFTQKFASAIRLIRIPFIITSIVFFSACGPSAEPTPTPTKTPQLAVDTPTPPPATPTPEEIATAVSVAVPVEPTPLPGDIAPYTGLSVADPSRLNLRPLLVCVNNDAVGRSAHVGLSKADLVYEYIVDGFTLTRLTAIYHSQDVEQIGPVRSARMPNIWMSYMFNGALACSGGSDEIRYLLRNEVTFPYLDADLDDPSQTRYFQSVGTDYRTRIRTSTAGIHRWLGENGEEIEWSRPGFDYSPEPQPNPSGASSQLQISYPGGNSVEWRYDANAGGYLRWQGGVQQTDGLTGQPIVASNVIVMAAEHTETDIVEDSLGTKSVDVSLWGFGDLRIFRDGQVYEGTWRADPENPPRWLGPGDQNITLKPGQSWIQVVRDKNELTY